MIRAINAWLSVFTAAMELRATELREQTKRIPDSYWSQGYVAGVNDYRNGIIP